MPPALDGLVALSLERSARLAGVSLDPTTVGELPPVVRAAGSFVLVLVFGVGILVRFQRFVEGSIDTSMARPHVSAVYGLIGYGIVGFIGFVGLTQLTYVGLTGGPIAFGIVGLLAVAILVLAGLGYTVVGAGLVQLLGERQPWNGLVVGAVLSGVAWLVLPPVAALLVWLLVPAVGIGGPVREWVHAERTVASETGP